MSFGSEPFSQETYIPYHCIWTGFMTSTPESGFPLVQIWDAKVMPEITLGDLDCVPNSWFSGQQQQDKGRKYGEINTHTSQQGKRFINELQRTGK